MKVLKFILKAILIGIVTLLLINFFGQWVGLYIPINFINIFLIGIFYLPGLILVLLVLLL